MNIRLTIILLMFAICNMSIAGQTKPNFRDSLKNEIFNLKKSIKEIDSRQNYQDTQINNQVGMLDTAFDGVSAELGASSNFIGIFGIIIAIFSIGLSIYVSRIEKNVKAMKGDNEILLQKNIQIKQELEALGEKITKDSTGLYKLVRNEESNHILDRLISVPEDIVNLFGNLASRDLEPENFSKIKEAFLQVTGNSKFDYYYLTLLFQHFSGQSILDSEVKPLFIAGFENSFDAAFRNDAVKSASDYFKAIVEIGLTKSKEEINSYVVELCKSQYSIDEAVYFSIINEMKNRELKFGLYDIIKKTPETLIFRQTYGKLLLDFKFENLTPQENAIIEDIKNITTVKI